MSHKRPDRILARRRHDLSAGADVRLRLDVLHHQFGRPPRVYQDLHSRPDHSLWQSGVRRNSHGEHVLHGLASCRAQEWLVGFFIPPTTHYIANVDDLTPTLEEPADTEEVEDLKEELGDSAKSYPQAEPLAPPLHPW